MDCREAILKTAAYVKGELSGEATGHDWWHVYRVWQLAKRIATAEQADLCVIELAVLLHDIADHKFHGGDHAVLERVARKWLEDLELEEATVTAVLSCIATSSYSKGKAPASIEAAILQDADRLDAIGAIGIARAFATGTHFDNTLYDPERSKDEQSDTTLGHFYDKLLKLRDQMHTDTAKVIAAERHQYLEDFLDRFYKEWEGKR